MKKFLAILLCKLARAVGKPLGKGSSMPGKLALKLCPDILSRLQLPSRIVAVTGSNGKTSTVELIAHILRSDGRRVAYNKEGSNQIEGVATLLLCASTLGGRVKADVVLLESDERFARHTFKWFHPTHYLILNLYRDQLTRNGHPQWMYHIVEQSIHPDSRLLLNADDPLVSRYGAGRDNVTWFGVARQPWETAAPTGAYDDGAVCPACMAPMTYEFRHFNHIGGFSCPHCGHRRHDPQYTGAQLDLTRGTLTVAEENGQTTLLPLPNVSWYGASNLLAAYALCRELGVDPSAAAQAAMSFTSRSGRVVEYTCGGRPGTLLASKHENSISYDQSLRRAVQGEEDCTVTVLVDAISRKYFTSETSWLWDVGFETLAHPCVRHILLTGRYCHDLAVRFQAAGLMDKTAVIPDLPQGVEHLKTHGVGRLYTVTCFSDKDKFLSLVEVAK